ncbi:MAG: hypothetical protein GF418_06720 [Chitinivibrionales bacterium]|nr:hypothetical protein [Chitinivibrionales bacterium]MBD3395304.1 hypothetical protein [Chitinivibrionales bacterium]
MFFWIGVVFFSLGWIPLVLTVGRGKGLTPEQMRARVKGGLLVVLIDIVILIAFNTFLHFYTELLWFRNLGYLRRFWTILTSELTLFGIGAGVAFVFLEVNRRLAGEKHGGVVGGGMLVVIGLVLAAFLGLRAGALWHPALLYINQAASPVTEPIFNKPVNFYLFSLPFFALLQQWVALLIFIGGIFTVGCYAASVQMPRGSFEPGRIPLKRAGALARHLLVLAGLLCAAFAWKFYLDLFKLLYSTEGAVTGAGYVDAKFRTLGLYSTVIVLAAAAVSAIIAAFSGRFRQLVLGIRLGDDFGVRASARTAVVPGIAVALVGILNWVLPGLITAAVVNPNEITVERPYIKHNIEFTQRAYGIDEDKITDKKYDVGRNINRDVVHQNRPILDNIRLWDWRALMDNLREQQEIRLYYEFNDVDIDRYHLGDDYRQIMLSVRELEKRDLDPRSKTWVSTHLKYTHGYGMVFLPAHEFLPQGGPNFLIQNIPPEIRDPSLSLKRPAVYYGERTDDHVYVNTSEKEFDYPSGEENVYSDYAGDGGVSIGPLVRRIAYAWKFDGHRILFSTYFTKRSRVMFHRHIVDRAKTIAPFLVYDNDPYAVLGDDGGIYYIIDAYTVSSGYPYSERYRGGIRELNGINYIRNSVKVVVDAYNGNTTFYTVDEDDIVLSTYRRVFPDVFKPLDAMPASLRRHIRYPSDLLTVQAGMYSTYHMQEPDVFYQREDVWQFATERYREDFQTVRPYYVLTQFPGSDKLEFVLMMPFTPRNKNVMNAWMAGRCDMPNYGELVVFPFPKGVEVLGTRQIEARIDQDTEMSQAMTLWGQRGSEVLRGNMLAIPLFNQNTLYMLYAEPIFLQAENAKLPEFKRVALADQEGIVWAEDFDNALLRLLGEHPREPSEGRPGVRDTTEPRALQARITAQIREYLRSYRAKAGRGEFAAAGRELEAIDSVLHGIDDEP